MGKKELKITKTCNECGAGALKNSIVCTECGAELRTSSGMHKVYPITQEQVKLIRESINVGKHGKRNEFMFLLLTNTALRISDALSIKVGMVRDKNYLELIEQKTGKPKKFILNSFLKEIITEYVKGMNDEDYLFASQKLNKDGEYKLSRQQAYGILKEAAKAIGVNGFANHSCRKTYARLIYEKTGDIAFVMRLLNHSSEAVTLKYLHLTEEADNERIMDFSLF